MADRTVAELRAAASRVLDHAVLREVVVASVQFESRLEYAGEPLDADTEIDIRAEASDGPDVIRVWNRHVTTATKSSEGDGVETSWKLTIETVGLFHVEPPNFEFGEDELHAFAVIVGIPTLHPFARAATQSITASSAFPAFTMGFFTPISALPDDRVIDLSPSVGVDSPD